MTVPNRPIDITWNNVDLLTLVCGTRPQLPPENVLLVAAMLYFAITHPAVVDHSQHNNNNFLDIPFTG